MSSMKEVRVTLRAWQIKAEQLEIEYLRNSGSRPLLAACPGAGKTIYGVRRACRFFNEQDGELVIVVAPTTNIKLKWIKDFRSNGFKTTGNVENATIRDALDNEEDIKSDYEVIVITYSQLAKGDELFKHYPKRYKTLVIADEVHHADDQAEFGRALANLSENAAARLALSGTPFNSQGGALAMCDSEPAIDDDGRPVRRTLPFYTYSYGDGLTDKEVCRVVEFGIVYGKAKVTYESLLTGETFDKVVEGKRKTDSLRPFLDITGEFLPAILDEAILRLDAVKAHNRRAAMLVVARDTTHAEEIEDMLMDKCGNRYSIQRIVHDTEKAHDRIERLTKDNTDIVVTVRMVSEGIDVKRFRVGVFASDYTTRMFFIQFIGRFVRWDTDLLDGQYAWVLFPGHVKLVEYAREIEKMIIDAALALGGGEGEVGLTSTTVLGTESAATKKETMARGTTLDADMEDLFNQFIATNPDLRGKYTDSTIADIVSRVGKSKTQEFADSTDSQRTWRKKNESIMKTVVRLLRQTRSGADDEETLYAKVQTLANRQVGIRRIDTLTPEDKLEKRWLFLRQWSQAILSGIEPEFYNE